MSSINRFMRDSFWGRIAYHFSGHKVFYHKEEAADYIIPDKYLAEVKPTLTEEAKSTLPEGNNNSVSSDNSTVASTDKIIVTWDGDDDPENPKNWPLWQKSIFMFEICFLTTVVYMSSAIFTPGVQSIMEDLHTTRVKATLPLTMFVIGYGIGPMFLSPMSENAIFGRTNIYIISLFIFFIFQIPISLVNDLPALATLRFFSGLAASPALATGGASMGDITAIPYMPVAIGLWSISAVCGPALGPLIGSIMVVKRDWHWTFWFVTMTSGIAFVFLGFLLPETFEKTLLYRKARRLRKLTGNGNITSDGEIENQGLTARQLAIETLWRPVEISLFEPVVLLINIFIALVYSILYLWFEAFPIAYGEVYHFALIPLGVTFVSVMVGVILGAAGYIYYVYKKFTVPLLNGTMVYPEVFIPVMIVGSVLMPIGIFIFGWTVSPDLHWFGSLVGAALFAVGGFFIFQSGFLYLSASFPRYLASVFAGNDLFRSLIAGCFPLFGSALYNNLKTEKFPVAWGSSVLAFISLVMILIPVLFYLNGPKLRARSKYADVY